MAELTVQPVTKAGIADLLGALAAAAAAGDSVVSASGLLLVVNNADASPHTVTIPAPVDTTVAGSYGEVDVDDMTLVVAAGDAGAITIPLGYVSGAGVFSWTYDDVTDVTVGVFSLAP